MVDDISNVLAKFIERKQQPVTNPIAGLAEKLRQKADSVRQAQGVTERPVVDATEDNKYLSRCIYTGSITPFKCDAVITTNAGIHHEMKLSFETGKCVINSQLFPSPSYIVEKLSEEKPKNFTMTVKDFFNIARVIKILDGTKVSISNEVKKIINR